MKSSRNLRPFVKVNKPKSYSHLLKHPKKTGWTTFGAKENLILVAICIRQFAVTFGLGGGDLFTVRERNRLILMIYRVRFSRAIYVCVWVEVHRHFDWEGLWDQSMWTAG